MTRDEIFLAFDRQSVETVTLSKYVTEYKEMWKWMVESFSKFQGRDIKIDRAKLIRVAKPFIFFNVIGAVAYLVAVQYPYSI